MGYLLTAVVAFTLGVTSTWMIDTAARKNRNRRDRKLNDMRQQVYREIKQYGLTLPWETPLPNVKGWDRIETGYGSTASFMERQRP